MSDKSILTKEVFESLLTQARQHMGDNNLGPVILMYTVDGQRLACNLTKLPRTPEDKRQHLLAAGASLRQDGVMVKEAILIYEAWFVKGDKSAAMETPPSEHPERQEAVVLVGRNAESTHSTCAIQPFTRKKNGKPVWQEVMLHTDNEAGSGLLDWFFTGQELEAICWRILLMAFISFSPKAAAKPKSWGKGTSLAPFFCAWRWRPARPGWRK